MFIRTKTRDERRALSNLYKREGMPNVSIKKEKLKNLTLYSVRVGKENPVTLSDIRQAIESLDLGKVKKCDQRGEYVKIYVKRERS